MLNIAVPLPVHDVVVLVGHVSGRENLDGNLSRVLKGHGATVALLRPTGDSEFTLVLE